MKKIQKTVEKLVVMQYNNFMNLKSFINIQQVIREEIEMELINSEELIEGMVTAKPILNDNGLEILKYEKCRCK